MTIAEHYADFAARLQLEDVPPDLVEKAKLHMLDTVGCAIAASTTDYAAVKFAALLRLEGGCGTTAIGQSRSLGLRDAVLFNGGLANALDYDDTYTPNLNHISGGAVPLVLALGARDGASGREVIAAYLIAMETATHIGLGVPGNAVMRRGFSTSGTLNGFANALAAGRLLRLTPDRLVAAQGVALTLIGGAMEGLREGAWSKRLNAGQGAVSGLTAAMMAAEGMSGPSMPYEGDLGLYHMLVGPGAAVDWEATTAGLGDQWEFARVAIKAFPLVHHAHNIVDAAIRLNREDSVRPEDVEAITALVTEDQVPLLCQPESQRRHPPNDYAAIFSVYHLVATALARGRMTLDECEGDALQDPVIRDLRNRIGYELDPDSLFPEYFSGGLVAHLKDGREIRRYDRHHFSSDKRPMPRGTVIEKFRNNAGRVYRDDRVDAIITAVMALSESGSPKAVTDLLGAG